MSAYTVPNPATGKRRLIFAASISEARTKARDAGLDPALVERDSSRAGDSSSVYARESQRRRGK